MKRLFLYLVLWGLLSCHAGVQKPTVTGFENTPIPSLNLLLEDSTTYINTNNLGKNKKLMIFYFSPSCPYCRAQMREILNNINDFKSIQICAITAGDFKALKDFSSYFNLRNYPNIIAGLDTGYVMAQKFQITEVPFTAEFSKNKELKAAYFGRITGKTLMNIAIP